MGQIREGRQRGDVGNAVVREVKHGELRGVGQRENVRQAAAGERQVFKLRQRPDIAQKLGRDEAVREAQRFLEAIVREVRWMK